MPCHLVSSRNPMISNSFVMIHALIVAACLSVYGTLLSEIETGIFPPQCGGCVSDAIARGGRDPTDPSGSQGCGSSRIKREWGISKVTL